MAIRIRFAPGLIATVSTIPLVMLTFSLKQFHGTMLTDSIPVMGPVAKILVFTISLPLVLLAGRIVADNKPIGCLLLISVTTTYSMYDLLFDNFYENYLFSKETTIYQRSVQIRKAMIINHRGSRGAYAEINPNGFKAVVGISDGLFGRWNRSTAGSSMKTAIPSQQPPCFINVTVQKSGSGAERIIDRRPYTERDIMTGCRPV